MNFLDKFIPTPNNTTRPKVLVREFIKRDRNLLYIIILIAIFLRLFSINAPLLDRHSLGQITDAAMARNFYEGGYQILFPQVDDPGATAYLPEAFPLNPFIIALFYKIFGVKEIIGRLMAMLFSILAIVFTYKIAKKYYGSKIALFAAGFLSISPIFLYYGRVFVRHEMVVFFILAGFYYFCEWLERQEWLLFLASSVLFALAFLTNMPALYIGLVLLYVSYKKYISSLLFRWKLWLFALLVLTPCILWQFQVQNLIRLGGENLAYDAYLIRDFANPKYYLEWLKGDFFAVIFSTLSKTILTPPGFVLFLIGLLMVSLKKVDYRFHIWLLAALIYFILDPYVIYSHHDYYFLSLVPVASIFIAQPLAKLTDSGFRKNHKIWDYKILLIITGFLTVYYTVHTIGYWYEYDKRVVPAAKEIEKRTAKTAMIVTDYRNEGLLYYSHRKGFSIASYIDRLKYQAIIESPYYALFETLQRHPELNRHGDLAIDYLEKSREKGAKYFATVDFNNNYKLHEYIINNYRVVERKNNFILTDLQIKLDQK